VLGGPLRAHATVRSVHGRGFCANSSMEEWRAGAQPRSRVYFALAHEACADSAE
jgi:hypothetical protein